MLHPLLAGGSTSVSQPPTPEPLVGDLFDIGLRGSPCKGRGTNPLAAQTTPATLLRQQLARGPLGRGSREPSRRDQADGPVNRRVRSARCPRPQSPSRVVSLAHPCYECDLRRGVRQGN